MNCRVVEVQAFIGGTPTHLIFTPDGISISPSLDDWVNAGRYDPTDYRTTPVELGEVVVPLDLAEKARQRVETQEALNRYAITVRDLIESVKPR